MDEFTKEEIDFYLNTYSGKKEKLIVWENNVDHDMKHTSIKVRCETPKHFFDTILCHIWLENS